MNYRKRHINPKIRNLRPKKKFWKWPLFWIIVGLIVIVTTAYFVLFYPKFQVKSIEISGNEKLETEDIQHTVFANLPKKIAGTGIFSVSSQSIFVVEKNAIIKNVLAVFPGIETIEVQKKFPNAMTLKIRERQPVAVFCQNDSCFSIDKNGVIFEKVENNSPDTIVITKESIDKKISTGEEVVQKNMMEAIYKVKNNLKNNFQVEIKEVFVANPLIFTTSETWQIYFNPDENMDLEIAKMNALLKNEITQDARKNLQYIYLQYQDRAYYK